MKDIVITTGPLVGLGDHLLYSTLPERFSRLGHKVFLDGDNCARNQEVLDLVWGHNPYVEGVSNAKPNAGYVHQGRFFDIANTLPIGCIEAMERAHDLPPMYPVDFEIPVGYSMAPKIYYTPQPFYVDLENSVLFDFSALSSYIDDRGWQLFLQKMQDRFGGTGWYMIQHAPSVGGRRQLAMKEETPSLSPSSLFQYADMMAGCRAWIGSEAGSQFLAAAVRGDRDVYDADARPEIVSLIAPDSFNSRAFTLRGVDYRTSRWVQGDDYHNPVEVPYHRYHELCKINGSNLFNEWKAR